ncbi:class II aldolase/adducin family protein [Microbacterium sp. 11MF]|uniref:class II aldolase/adducin family protein n=1 Tax=Microbacterium sp. 11MF TaxID=1169146 RepID=UPI00036F5329|nr:class II aldolase/adducin family protein [Microbacterium sp. 11MF]
MTMTSHHHDLRASVAAASRALAGHGLLIGTAGNVSARAGDVVAVTATGVVLGKATADDVTVVDLGGAVVEGTLAPTSELALHLGVLRAAPAEKVSAVVHTHAPNATALSLVLDELPVVHYQQLVLGGSLRVAPFHAFGTPDLAAAVGAALDGRLAALMANHGTVALGADLTAAVENALLVEWLAELYLRAASVGTPRALDPAQQQEVVAHAMRLGYGTTKPVSA